MFDCNSHSPLSFVSRLTGLFPDGGFLSSLTNDPLVFASSSSLLCCLLLDRSLGAVEGRSLSNSSSSRPSSSENLTDRLVEPGAVSGLARPPRLRDWPLAAAEGV